MGICLLEEFFPTYEAVGSIHTDKDHLHFHAIISSVDCQTGKMLNMNMGRYRILKDRVQQMCKERGLSAIDWRKATREKREKETEPEEIVTKSFAERGLEQRGKMVWKDHLRRVIDETVIKAKNKEEFIQMLEEKGVILTRFTERTVSYKLEDYSICRGDSLGADYTASAVLNQLDRNAQEGTLNDMVLKAERRSRGLPVFSKDEERRIYQCGRTLGLKREDVAIMISLSASATREDVHKAWNLWNDSKAQFWKGFKESQKSINQELDELYLLRRKMRVTQWITDPLNYRVGLWGWLYAFVLLIKNPRLEQIENEIAFLTQARDKMQKELEEFQKASQRGAEALRNKKIPVDEFVAAILKMQTAADNTFYAAMNVDTEKQLVLTADGLFRKQDYAREMVDLFER